MAEDVGTTVKGKLTGEKVDWYRRVEHDAVNVCVKNQPSGR